MAEESKKPHFINLENRNKCNMNGIEKVVTSSDTALSLVSSYGAIFISGTNLKIIKFNADSGEFMFCGQINVIKYDDVKTPLIKKLLK